MPLSKINFRTKPAEVEPVEETPPPLKPKKPVEQLKLLGAETNRQLLVVSARRTGFNTRAAILITAAGVLTTVQTREWISGWQLVSMFLSIVAAVLGLFALRPVRSKTANVATDLKSRLVFAPYDVEYFIVESSMEELKQSKIQVQAMAETVAIGYLVLLLAWISTLAVVAIPHIKIV